MSSHSKKKICHCRAECGKLLSYHTRLHHYKGLNSSGRCGSESPTSEDMDTYQSYHDSDVEITGKEKSIASSELMEKEVANEGSESFPKGDDWNGYNEDDELDVEHKFWEFEEILDSDMDITDNGK